MFLLLTFEVSCLKTGSSLQEQVCHTHPLVHHLCEPVQLSSPIRHCALRSDTPFTFTSEGNWQKMFGDYSVTIKWLVSCSRILKSCQPHMVTSGRITFFFFLNCRPVRYSSSNTGEKLAHTSGQNTVNTKQIKVKTVHNSQISILTVRLSTTDRSICKVLCTVLTDERQIINSKYVSGSQS